MKNFALIAAVAAVALPASVQAAETREKNWYDGSTTMNIKVLDGEIYNSDPFIPADGQTMTLTLVNGGQLMLEGDAAYIISESGSKFLANNAPHATTAGITYQTHDGEVLYATPTAQEYTIVADAKDFDNDGFADDVDFTIQ